MEHVWGRRGPRCVCCTTSVWLCVCVCTATVCVHTYVCVEERKTVRRCRQNSRFHVPPPGYGASALKSTSKCLQKVWGWTHLHLREVNESLAMHICPVLAVFFFFSQTMFSINPCPHQSSVIFDRQGVKPKGDCITSFTIKRKVVFIFPCQKGYTVLQRLHCCVLLMCGESWS